MFLRSDIRPKISVFKNLITDQTYNLLMGRLNTSGLVFTSDGLGTTTAASTTITIAAAGFNDQRIVVVGRYVAPTASGNENFGAVLRCQGLENAASQNYYYARCQLGEARISRFLGGSSVTLASAPFVLPQNTDVTITFSAVGSALQATFDAGGSPATVTLSTIDTQVPTGGFLMARTLSATGFFKSILAEEV